MAEAKQQSENDQSRPMSKKGKDLLTRRNFIASTAGLTAMNLVGRAAQKNVEKDEKMPVWSGDLKSSTKRIPRIPTTAKSNGLNMIVIIADTFRADHLSCYGSTCI